MSVMKVQIQEDGWLQLPPEMKRQLERPGTVLRLVKEGEDFVASVEEAPRKGDWRRLQGSLAGTGTMAEYEAEKRAEREREDHKFDGFFEK